MLFLFYILFCTILILQLNKYLLKKNILINDSGDVHQKFTSKLKTSLTGGLFILVSLLIEHQYFQLLYSCAIFFIFILGIFSDLKLIKSAKSRLVFQFLIVFIFCYYSELSLNDTRVYYLDYFLSNQLINYFFISFCILIVINGSNFFDGLNTLAIGYYLLISLIIFLLNHNNEIIIGDLILNELILILTTFYLLNFFNKMFLGDSGSYLLGFIFSVILIELYSFNPQISPFFIILLLWHPCFEILFSMIRKNITKKSPMSPDSNHLHQLIFYFIKKKLDKKTYQSNIISANLINLYNLIIFLISSQFLTNTAAQISLILLNSLVYTFIYLKLFYHKFKLKN